MRRFVTRSNFSCTLIGNRPQSLTGHIVKRYVQQQKMKKSNRVVTEKSLTNCPLYD